MVTASAIDLTAPRTVIDLLRDGDLTTSTAAPAGAALVAAAGIVRVGLHRRTRARRTRARRTTVGTDRTA